MRTTLYGREEAVLDALLQRVGVDRLAEVVRRARRRSSPSGVAVRPIWVADVEVVEDLAPRGVLGGAAAVALVDDDEVEEVGRELLEDVLAPRRCR